MRKGEKNINVYLLQWASSIWAIRSYGVAKLRQHRLKGQEVPLKRHDDISHPLFELSELHIKNIREDY